MNQPFDTFNFNTTRWQPENALCFAAASQLAYEDAAAIDAGVKAWGFTRSDYLESPPEVEWDTQLYVASNPDMVIVAFRGTQPGELKDRVYDGDIIMAKSAL